MKCTRSTIAIAAIVFALPGGTGAIAEDALAAVVVDGDCEQQAFSMLVSVKTVKDARGTITVDVHDDDPAKFLKSGGKLARIRVPAVAGETRLCIAVTKPGVFALALYHDRDGDTKLDKTWVGLPSEPFGVSNNPPFRLGPPRHKDAAFEVTGPGTPVNVILNK
jgi:uncharacterized protein (DUF2141 family)